MFALYQLHAKYNKKTYLKIEKLNLESTVHKKVKEK